MGGVEIVQKTQEIVNVHFARPAVHKVSLCQNANHKLLRVKISRDGLRMDNDNQKQNM